MYPSSIATIQDARRGFAKSKKRGGSIAPSPKAQEVFRRVVVNCEKQCDVAEDLKISSGRVSQHVRRVRQWLAAGSPGDPETTAQQQQRLDRAVAKARHEAILAFAMSELRRLAAIHRHATTRIEEKEGENTKVVTTYRDQALSVQHLKVAQRAVIELAKLAELDPLPPPRPVMPSDHDLFRAVRDVLCDWRQRAEHLGHVPQSNWEELVGAVIAAVIGRNRDPLPLDEPAREFIDNLLRGNAACSPSKPSAGPVEAESTAGSPADSSQAGGSPEETCIVPPIPRDPAWNPFVTGAFAFLSEPTVRHPRGEGTLADSTPKTERQSDGETERQASANSLSVSQSLRPSVVPPVPLSSSADPLQTPKDTSPPSPPLPPTNITSNSITPSNPSAAGTPAGIPPASSAVTPPPGDEKIKIFTPYPPITIHFLSTLP